jgi:hypothetical protein
MEDGRMQRASEPGLAGTLSIPRRGMMMAMLIPLAGVIDGPQSVVWDEAENRLRAQKALMEYLAPGRVDARQ